MAEWKNTMLETGIDQLLEILTERRKVSSKDLSCELSLPQDTIETWAEILSKENIITIEYDTKGNLILINKSKNVKEKRNKAESLSDEVDSEISSIEENVKEEARLLDDEHKSIKKFEETIKREYGESEKLQDRLKMLSGREEELKKLLDVIQDEESKIKKDYVSINEIITTKMKQIQETEEKLKAYESQKDRLFQDIEIIKRLSKSIKNEAPENMADKIETIEEDILEIRKQSRELDKKYSTVRKLISKI